MAPEVDGGMALLAHLVGRGVLVSLGHTDADAAAAHAAYDAGAVTVTHLWNAQRPITSRDPGIGAVADRFVVVTDAVAPAGTDAALPAVYGPDGGLMGSTTPLDACVRNLVAIGVPLPSAVAAATRRPAAVLGRPDLGRLAPGGVADVVVLDGDLQVQRVLLAGREHERAPR
jgi:N-acetylglucosamine-6-phosphate deacetylase